MTRAPEGYQSVSPYLLYEDAARAVEFLAQAFGFVERRTMIGGAGRDHHELVLGVDGLVMLGQAGPGYRSPLSLRAHPSSLIHVYVPDAASLRERAQAAGAQPTELELTPSGDKRFSATDPEGQVWVFAERVRVPIQ